ncbi:hypothetical protein, partial [Staphylococcus aureus]|uniref:hypothetical protein n=1 Tax=Staphylococcus aureus TaxID=1280 RepID=UPI001C9E9124
REREEGGGGGRVRGGEETEWRTGGRGWEGEKVKRKSKKKEKGMGEGKTGEKEEKRKERNEWRRAKGVSESRRRGKKQAIVTSQERFLATMVANLRSARVERC